MAGKNKTVGMTTMIVISSVAMIGSEYLLHNAKPILGYLAIAYKILKYRVKMVDHGINFEDYLMAQLYYNLFNDLLGVMFFFAQYSGNHSWLLLQKKMPIVLLAILLTCPKIFPDRAFAKINKAAPQLMLFLSIADNISFFLTIERMLLIFQEGVVMNMNDSLYFFGMICFIRVMINQILPELTYRNLPKLILKFRYQILYHAVIVGLCHVTLNYSNHIPAFADGKYDKIQVLLIFGLQLTIWYSYLVWVTGLPAADHKVEHVEKTIPQGKKQAAKQVEQTPAKSSEKASERSSAKTSASTASKPERKKTPSPPQNLKEYKESLKKGKKKKAKQD